ASLLAALTLTACSPSVAGDAPPTTPSFSAGASSGAGGAPRVPQALDTSKYQQDPCSMLGVAQLQALNISATGKPRSASTGPACDWSDDNGPSKMFLTLTLVTKGDGMAGLYSRQKNFQLFQPLPPIEGYPAVLADQVDSRKAGSCTAVVAVTDQLVYMTQVQLRSGAHKSDDYSDPCPRTQKIATEVLKNMKAGG
ncbi:DUF3558 domain-containing protein, partial [Streptoalloteichus tenebrarius]